MKKKILIGSGIIIAIVLVAAYIVTRPTKTEDGSYKPSPLALYSILTDETNYEEAVFENPYKEGKLKILAICTEEKDMVMKNGEKFSTGNHPVETMVPMMHLINAGFDVDIYTPTGKSVKLEMWAMPENDQALEDFYEENKEKFEHPKSLADFVQNDMATDSNYISIFLPGGHGAMLGLPDDENVGEVVKRFHNDGLYTISICHGPAAFIAAGKNVDKESFIYNGYKVAAFPEKFDLQFESVGYFPGTMPWLYGTKLNELGMTFVNDEIDNTTHVDRKLISGASPFAANNLGKLAADKLLEEVNN